MRWSHQRELAACAVLNRALRAGGVATAHCGGSRLLLRCWRMLFIADVIPLLTEGTGLKPQAL